jgi:hypothetical protein
MKHEPTRDEVESVKAEGRRPGWLRSRFMGQPWPREGVAACGRSVCEVCDQGKTHAEPKADTEKAGTA